MGVSFDRLVDMRRGEGAPLALAGAGAFLLVGAYTTLETARDALLLSRFPSRDLGLVYVAVAALVLPVAAISARVSSRIGPRRALAAGLFLAAVALIALFLVPTNNASVVSIYVLSGIVGATLVPLFWTVFGTMFTVAQGRRLVGPIAAAAILGGAAGSLLAVASLRFLSVMSLLVVAAATFVLAMFAVLRAGSADVDVDLATAKRPTGRSDATRLPPRDPFVLRIALLIALSTAALLVLDFFFKWTIARSVPHDRVPLFVARVYAGLNLASLIAQLALSRAFVRRFGVAVTSVIMPFAVFSGAAVAIASGGALLAVLALKTIDGTLRNSVHRTTTELLYMPLPPAVRIRAKPVLDGALVRIVQAIGGVILFGLGVSERLSPMALATATTVAAAAWLAIAWNTRRPYLALLRRTIGGDAVTASSTEDPLDLESATALVEYLSHGDPAIVVGAMDALSRRKRDRLIPALILLHEDEAVLTHALALFAASQREDWIPRARLLLRDRRDAVRSAASRALASHGQLDAKDLDVEASPRAKGYATLLIALATPDGEPLRDASLRGILERDGEGGDLARLGVAAALADLPADPRTGPLLDALMDKRGPSDEWTLEIARAARSQHATGLVERLIPLLASRRVRETVRATLVSMGGDALEGIREKLADPASPRALRIQLPDTLRRIATPRSAEVLLDTVERDRDGFVRYKALRALGRLIADAQLRVDRRRVERLALANLVEHFRLLGAREPFGADLDREDATGRLLLGLIDDKIRQSLERVFRLLKIAYPLEDIRSVHAAYLSDEKSSRANAAEFFDTLLRDREQERLRELIRIRAEEPSVVEALVRARPLLPSRPPAGREEALALLFADKDATLGALARLHAARASGSSARVAIGSRDDGAGLELSVGAPIDAPAEDAPNGI